MHNLLSTRLAEYSAHLSPPRAPLWALLLLLSSPIALAASTLEEVYHAEATGQWQQALALAQQLPKDNDQPNPHHAALQKTLRALEAARFYAQSGATRQADTLLTTQLNILETDSVGNRHLIIATQIALNEVWQQVARVQLDKAQALFESKRYDEAIALFDQVIKRDAAAVTTDTRRQAEIGMRRAESAKARTETPSFWQGVGTTLAQALESVALWLFYFLLILGIFLAGRAFRSYYLTRPGNGLALEDHMAAKDQRDAMSQALSRDMAHAIRKLAGGAVTAPEASGLMDLDVTSLPNTADPLGGIATIISHVDASTEPVKVGIFSFKPEQLFLYLSLLFKRPYQFLYSGVLSKSDKLITLLVTKRDQAGTVMPGGHFEASALASDAHARDKILQDVAAQMAVSLAGSKVTHDWRSLRFYLEAESKLGRELKAERREPVLEEAKQLLQSAITFDPANWMARFKLASVLRTLGENRAAKDQFDYVERMLEAEDIWRSHHLGAFLTSRPQFPWINRYNLIVSFSKIGDAKAVRRASALMQRLVAELEEKSDGKQAPPATAVEPMIRELTHRWERIRDRLHKQGIDIDSSQASNLLILAKGGRAAVLCAELEHLREEGYLDPATQQETSTAMKQLLERVGKDETWLWQMSSHIKSGGWQNFAQAHAAAQNAYGRACYVMGRYADAVKYLEWAIQIHVPCNFPEPFINLAAVYIKQRRRLCPDWAHQAEDYLKTALTMSPYNHKAHYLMGKIYADKSYADYDKALAEYKQAGDNDSLSLYQRGRIQIRYKKNFLEGAELLRRSAAYAQRSDFRHAQYLDTVIQLAALSPAPDQDKLNEHLQHARHLAIELQKNGVTQKLRVEGTRLKQKILALLPTPRGDHD